MSDNLNLDMIVSLKKELLEELRNFKKAETKQLRIIEQLFPNEPIIKEYHDMVSEELDIKIEVGIENVKICLPQLQARKVEFISRPIYEDTMIYNLTKAISDTNFISIKHSLIVFEHFSPDNINKGLRDNDNYNSSEIKHIIDGVVTARCIANDIGKNCYIMHISTICKDEPHTVVHILNMDAENYQKSLISIIENSKKINNISCNK